MGFSRSGKSHFAKSELLMVDLGSRSALAAVDTKKDLGVSTLAGPAREIRRNTKRLSGQASTRCMQRPNSFTNSVVHEWNALPDACTEPDSVN